jgi:hypothetical protein
MTWRRIKSLIKKLYNSFTMIRQENIAVAQIAQMFGSQLMNVQENAITDSGQKPQIVNIDPRQFLVPDAPSPAVRNKEQERLALMALQREAEAACPLPQETIQPIQSLPAQQNVSAEIAKEYKDTVFISKPTQSSVEIESKLVKNVERIAIALETIAGAIGKKPAAKKPKKKPIVK